MSSNKKIDDLFERFWQWRLEDSPEFATFVGVHEYDDKLQTYTLESFEQRKDAAERFSREANKLLSEKNVTHEDRTNLELFIYDLQVYLRGMTSKGYLFPINKLEGVHLEFERLIESMPQKTSKDFQMILSRFQALPKQISEIIDVMQKGMELKMTFHEVSVIKVIDQLEELQKKPQESCFYKPFLSISENIPKEERDAIISDAEKSLSQDVLPAFQKLQEFLKNEYSQHLREDVSISSMTDGEAFYKLCLEFHLGFDCSAEDIHKMGLNEVKRISEQMKATIASLDSEKDPKAFAEYLNEEKKFYFSTKEELLEAYNEIVFKKIEPKLNELFKKVPKFKLVIKPNAPCGISAYYLAGTRDGSRPGVFYVNTDDLKASPKYDMMTLALHEAMPGHHLQMSIMMEMKNVPAFRRDIEDRKYSDAPARFPLHSVFVEGWGLYSEYLGYELGLYEDKHTEYGNHSFEMLRACRLVVDTGIHAFGWSRDTAIEYLLEHTALCRAAVEGEVDRYITWPGQACAYKIGEMKIICLRRNAEEELGKKFDIREFHDVVLSSAGPIYFLEQNVKKFVQNTIRNICKC